MSICDEVLTTKDMVPEILNLPPSVQMHVIRIATNTDIAEGHINTVLLGQFALPM